MGELFLGSIWAECVFQPFASSIMSLSLRLRTSSGSHLLSSSPSSSSELITIVTTWCFFHFGCPLLSLFGGKGVRGETWYHCCSYVLCGTLNHRHSLSVCRRIVCSGIQTSSYNSWTWTHSKDWESEQPLVSLRLCPSASSQRVEKALQKKAQVPFNIAGFFLQLHGNICKRKTNPEVKVLH